MRKVDGTVGGTLAWSQVKIGALGNISGGDISSDGTLMVIATDVGGAYRRDTTATNTNWQQICTTAMQLDTAGLLTDFYYGAYAIAIAPSNPAVVRLAFQGRMLVSTDRGVTWTDESLNGTTGLYMTSNPPPPGNSKLKFDQSNSNVAYLGTQNNGLWRKLSGSSWTQIASIPITTETTDSNKVTLIAIDPTSGTTGSAPNVRHSTVLCAVNSRGLYKSTDGGATFAIVTGHPGAGTTFRCSTLLYDQDGKIWLVLNDGTSNNLFFSTNGGTSWTAISSVTNINYLAVDPKDASRLVGLANFKLICSVINPTANGALSSVTSGALGGATYFVKITYNGSLGETAPSPETSLAVSANHVLSVAAPPATNNAITWNVYVSTTTGTETLQASGIAMNASWQMPNSGLVAGAALPAYSTAFSGVYEGGNMKAMATTCPLPVSAINISNIAQNQTPAATIIPHPVLNRDIFLNGWGIFYVNTPWTTWTLAHNQNLVWYEDTVGIEELVAQSVFIHPDGTTFCSAQDRGLVVQNANQSLYATVNYPATASLIWGHNADYAIDNANFIATRTIGEGSADLSAYSLNKGQTWTPFTSSPAIASGGALAVSNASNIVVFPGQNYWPRYTTNGGTSWSLCTFSGFATLGDGTENGWGFGIPTSTRRIIVCADKQNAGTFYAYNYGPTGHTSQMGIWRSTDGGVNWTFRSNPAWGSGQNTGFHTTLQMVAGHLYICTGPQNGYFAEQPTCYSFRSEDGGATWVRLSNAINDIYYLALGAPKPGAAYAYAVYALGWLSNVFGLYRSDDKGATWVAVRLNPWFDPAYCMAADMSTFGRLVLGYTGSGFMQSSYSCPLLLN